MLKERTEAAHMVASALAAAEADMERTMATVAALTSTIMEARAVAKVSPVVAGVAVAEIAALTAHLFHAHAAIMSTHQALNQARADIGLSPRSFGPLQDCPPLPKPSGIERSNVVAIAA